MYMREYTDCEGCLPAKFEGACDVTILLFKKLNYNKESRIEADHNNQDGGRKAKSSVHP